MVASEEWGLGSQSEPNLRCAHVTAVTGTHLLLPGADSTWFVFCPISRSLCPRLLPTIFRRHSAELMVGKERHVGPVLVGVGGARGPAVDFGFRCGCDLRSGMGSIAVTRQR